MDKSVYTIVRDTREKVPWVFPKSDECQGTIVKKLDTADYSLESHLETFVLERKRSVAEFYQNIFEKRFEAELLRLDDFLYPFMIFEFTWEDILKFPIGSGLPSYLWHKVDTKKEFLRKSIARYQLKYKTKIIFAGKYGMDMATDLFHYVAKYGKKTKS